MNYYNENYLHQIELSEIDMDLYESLFPGWDDDHPEPIVVNSDKMDWARESYPIDIERVEKTLAELKERGCTHVEIMYHTDHIGYIFTGLDVHVSSKEEVEEHLKSTTNETEKVRLNRILELQKELSKLQKNE